MKQYDIHLMNWSKANLYILSKARVHKMLIVLSVTYFFSRLVMHEHYCWEKMLSKRACLHSQISMLKIEIETRIVLLYYLKWNLPMNRSVRLSVDWFVGLSVIIQKILKGRTVLLRRTCWSDRSRKKSISLYL